MGGPNEFFIECQDVLRERAACRFGDRRFLVELGKAWTAQLEIFLASRGIGLCQQGVLAHHSVGDERTKDEILEAAAKKNKLLYVHKSQPFPPIPGHLVAAMFAVQKLFRGTLDPDKKDHAIDAVNYTWIAFDERASNAKQPS